MVFAEFLSHSAIRTRVDFDVSISIKAANCEQSADAKSKKFGSPHLAIPFVFHVVVQILQIFGNVCNPYAVPDPKV